MIPYTLSKKYSSNIIFIPFELKWILRDSLYKSLTYFKQKKLFQFTWKEI